ncbi:MAG: hypothetical protein ABEH58_03370 [Haloplanus sp.]
MIRVENVPGDDGERTVVVEANRRYELGKKPGDRQLIDITGAKGTTAYGFCVDSDELLTLQNVPELVENGHLRPVDGTEGEAGTEGE